MEFEDEPVVPDLVKSFGNIKYYCTGLVLWVAIVGIVNFLREVEQVAQRLPTFFENQIETDL